MLDLSSIKLLVNEWSEKSQYHLRTEEEQKVYEICAEQLKFAIYQLEHKHSKFNPYYPR